jgi:hypothetical protein
MSLREKILSIQDIKTEELFIEEWDSTVQVKGLSGRQRGIYLQGVIDPKSGKMKFAAMYPLLVLMSTYDPETEKPLFEEGDIDAIAEKSGSALEKIAQVAQRLSGLSPEESAAKAEKN